MGATYRRRKSGRFLVTLHRAGMREFLTVATEKDAKQLVAMLQRQEILGGVSMIENLRKARAAVPPKRDVPTLQTGLSE